MSLYIKYRPRDFDTVVNQKHIIDILQYQVINKKLISNYLFFGSRGTGKTSVARILAKAVNCQNPKNGNPCNKCFSCISINENKNIDFVEIDAASHTQVDNIRKEIIDKAFYPPSVLKKKVYIIDEVHMLSSSSFNALLKIMEEPPEYLFFILATTEINKIKDTIVSRCQVFNFKKLNIDDISARLSYICEQEGYNYDKQALNLIAQNSDGAMRDSIKYLEQINFFEKITEDNVIKFLGIVGNSTIIEFIEYIKNLDLKSSFELLQKISNGGIDLIDFAKQIIVYSDEHFLEDQELYTKLSDCMINIIKDSKIYPINTILYKKELSKFFTTKYEGIDKNDDLIEKIVQNIDSTSLKTALKRYSSIQSFQNGYLHMNVSNEFQYAVITNEKNLQVLKKILNKIFNKEIEIKIDLIKID
ncbi:DNA polymerase III subunit gamma/tau [Candidatus Vampirococcus lugosii]|uniref:DNA polymerase III subunit gamma/tau n=1 Tax=Candidatus Vampirococcus lugosii TaxID=2789015 RepID=A0ABS5QKV8_9BACT|nr:DNA polymerase III subunits gamma and tau [Candidatus Vampirococcus lugosii]